MPCDTKRFPDGSFAIICRGRSKPKRCVECGRAAELLCDGPRSNSKTCDKPVCTSCAWRPEPEHDYCRACALIEQHRRKEAARG